MAGSELDQLKDLLAAPPVFVAPSPEQNGHAPAPRFADEGDMEMAATRATGFPPAPVLKDTGKRDDDGHPIFETTSLQAHVATKRAGQPIAFVPPGGPVPPTAALSPQLAALVAAANAQQHASSMSVVPMTPSAPLPPAPMNVAPIALPPAAAVVELASSAIRNSLATIQMLEAMGVIPVARGLSFRQRELLEEIHRVLGKLSS